MKKITLGIFVFTIAVMFTSCGSTKYGYDETTTKTINPAGWARAMPLVMDISVKPNKIVYTETIQREDIKKPINFKKVELMKNFVLSHAIKEHNADLLISPVFNITTSKDYKSIIIEVEGFPANYKNFRTSTIEDMHILDTCSKINNVSHIISIEGTQQNIIRQKK